MLNKHMTPVLAGLLIFSASAQAASTNPTLNDTFSIRAGGFLANIDTSVTLNGNKFSFEDVLDDSVTTGSVQGLWRITRKIRLNLGYWAVNRDESASLDQSDNIGGSIVPVGSTLSAAFDTSYFNGAIGYSFIRSDTTEFGADIGLANLSLKSELGASIPGGGNISFTAFDQSYLLPTIGLYITQSLSPKWSLSGRLGGVGLDLGNDFKGSVIEAIGTVEFRPWQNVGFGLAYMYNSANATLKNVGGGSGLDVDWKYQGPFGYVTLGFGN